MSKFFPTPLLCDDVLKIASDYEWFLESSSELTLSEEVWEISKGEDTTSKPSKSATIAKIVSEKIFYLVFLTLSVASLSVQQKPY